MTVTAAVVLVLGAAAGAALLRWAPWSGGAGASDVRAVAARFPAPSDWDQVEFQVRQGSACVDTHCPNAHRRWRVRQPPSADQVRSLLAAADWRDVRVDGDCRPRSNRTGAFPVCVAHARATGADVRLTVTGPLAGPHPFTASLLVEG